MAYRVISGFQDLETKVFYNIHEEIEETNKNLKKYLEAGVVVSDDEETPIDIKDDVIDTEETVIDNGENIVDDTIVDDGEKQLETTVEKTDAKDEKTNTKEDVKSKDNKKK